MKQSILNMTDWYRYTEDMTNKLSRKFKPFDIDVQTIKDTVSRNQQHYIYGVIYPRLKNALVEAGYGEFKNVTDSQFDYYMRDMFYFDIVQIFNEEKKIPRRLNFEKGKKDEVSGYIEDLLQFASRMGCYIPGSYDILI